MSSARVWRNGNREPYPWPILRDRWKRRWVSCPAGWHLDEPGISDDSCIGWATLTKLHGPLTEE